MVDSRFTLVRSVMRSLRATLRQSPAKPLRTASTVTRGWRAVGGGSAVAMLAGISPACAATSNAFLSGIEPAALVLAAVTALGGATAGFAVATLLMRRKVQPLAADATREAALRLLAEERHAAAQQDYQKLFEGSIDGIYVSTPTGELINANRALARMMGYDTPQQLIAAVKDIASDVYVDPSARNEYLRHMEQDGMVREFEYRVRTRDGSILWLSDSATVTRDDRSGAVRFEGSVRDITNQIRTEAALDETRRHLQQVIDTVPAVINVKDTNLRYILMNRYMAGIFGIEPDSAIGHTTSELMSRYGASKSDSHDREVLTTGKGLGFYEEEYLDASGAMRQWMVNKVPLLGADGNIESIVTVALDIGERKRNEQEMRKARDAAEAALKNLRETQESLIETEKLAALGRLVAGVAHEVNNPVGISLTVASSLERRCAMIADEMEKGSLRRSTLNEFISANRDAATQLVANLNRAAELIQSFKQVAVDRNFSHRRSFDISDLTEQLVTSLRPGSRKQNLTLTVDCEPDLAMNSYPGAYGQVLTNLFLNSVAHAFPNGEPGSIQIRVKLYRDSEVELLFSDDGCGMNAEVRRRAFDPFFTTRRDQGGTGLGLHIVYSLVTNRLGGRINLETAPGKGTQIQIILPRMAPLEIAAE